MSFNTNNQINAISLLRAVSSIYVMIAHILIWGNYNRYFPNPKVAVDVFIFISGFLIFNRYCNNCNLKKYYISRFFRIAPSYYFVTLVFAISYPILNEGLVYIQSLDPMKWPIGGIYDANHIVYSLKNILLHISFIFGLLPSYSNSTYIGDWSIGLEMQFYIIAPIVFFLYKRKFGFIIVAILAIALSKYADYWKYVWQYKEPSLILFKIHLFILGALTYSLIKEKAILYKISVALTIVAIISLQYWLQKDAYLSNNSSFYLIGCIILVILHNKIDFAFNNKVINFFSDISYPLYLIHGFFIALSGLIYKMDWLDQPLLIVMALVTIPCSIMSAWLISITVEKAGINYAINKIKQITISDKNSIPSRATVQNSSI